VSAYYGNKIGSSHEMTEYLLNEAHVACVAGADFGEDKCIRLSYATSRENIREAMQRIKKALEKL
jgi:aspartate aminotransferase